MDNIIGDSAGIVQFIDELIEKGVLYRGFIFQCEACRNSDWYAIEDVGQSFMCSRCRRAQTYKKLHWKTPQEPRWYYKLDEIVYQGYQHNMYIPILTLGVLQRSVKQSFFYLPEIEVRRDSAAERPDAEIDFCCCLDGEIAIGEATKRPRLGESTKEEKAELIKYKDLAISLGATIVVLSTFSEQWSPEMLKAAKEFFQGEKIAVKFLAKSDLLSHTDRGGQVLR